MANYYLAFIGPSSKAKNTNKITISWKKIQYIHPFDMKKEVTLETSDTAA